MSREGEMCKRLELPGVTVVKVAAVTGGRYVDSYSKCVLVPSDAQLLEFWTLVFVLAFSRVAHGAAVGTDQSVARFLTTNYPHLVIVDPYPVDPQLDGPWPLAGHRRNRRMLIESAADTLFAFPGGSGTNNCVNEAIKLGRTVYSWIGARDVGRFERIY